MRSNSLVPLLLMAAISVVAVVLIMRGDPAMPGQGGPMIDPGIFLPAKNAVYQVKAMALTAEQKLSGDEGPAVCDPRSFTVVQGLDHSPLTAAAMLGLAEGLTRRGGVAIFDPLRGPDGDTSPLLPLGAAYVLRVETVAGTPPDHAGGELNATVRIECRALRLPGDHPGSHWQADGAECARAVTIVHHSSGAAGGSWPEWYAAVGRGLAEAALTRWFSEHPPGQPAAPSEWGSRLPMPPQAAAVRWEGAFQDELVRGWIGRIDGLRVSTPDGGEETALAPLERRLKAGAWVEQPPQGRFRVWMREPGDPVFFSVAPSAAPEGWDLAYWKERDDPLSWYQGWVAAAGHGDAAALALLAHHRDCPGAGAALRARAAAIVAASATAAGADHAGATSPAPADATPAAPVGATVSLAPITIESDVTIHNGVVSATSTVTGGEPTLPSPATAAAP
jgi:hypothetical protein